MAVYLSDNEVLPLKTEEELKKACIYYSNDEFFRKVYANELRAFGVSSGDDKKTMEGQLSVFSNAAVCNLPYDTDNISDETFNEGVKGNGIFTCVPKADGSGYEVFPCRYTAEESMYNRSGTNCRMITTVCDKKKCHALSAELRGEEINRGWQVTDELLTLFIPDEKIGFFGSDVYVILKYIDGYNAVREILDKNYPDAVYKTGELSHDYMFGEWYLNDTENEESFALTLQNYGLNLKKEHTPFSIRYSSSNCGEAKMSARLIVSVDGIDIPFGKPQNIWHNSTHGVKDKNTLYWDNGCTIEDFKYKLSILGNLIKDNEDIVEKLGNKKILYPAGCMQNLLVYVRSVSEKSKNALIETVNSKYPKECYAIDLFILASTLPAEYKNNPQRLVKATEEIAEIQFKDFSLYDKPFQKTE